jgi:hypothetical protein
MFSCHWHITCCLRKENIFEGGKNENIKADFERFSGGNFSEFGRLPSRE